MEESGHYYTVYFTSLAVGFDKDVAYRQALLAQMPDEVGWLDAANMHINQCLHFSEYDLLSNKVAVPYEWRYLIEFALHSLPDKAVGNSSSFFQRYATNNLLARESPVSLKFGFLLHRLGDTYAHSMMSNQAKMYTVTTSGSEWECKNIDSLGHARDSHDPDYPFLRTGLFIEYLSNLYRILFNKVNERGSVSYRGRIVPLLSLGNLINVFRQILDDPGGIVRSSMRAGLVKDTTQIFFIQEIRKACNRELKLRMESYAPEKIEKQTLKQFLSEHPELRSIGINDSTIRAAVGSISDGINNTHMPK